MTLMKDKFEVIGKLKIKKTLTGREVMTIYQILRFEDILNDIDRHMEIFRNVKFPIKLLMK